MSKRFRSQGSQALVAPHVKQQERFVRVKRAAQITGSASAHGVVAGGRAARRGARLGATFIQAAQTEDGGQAVGVAGSAALQARRPHRKNAGTMGGKLRQIGKKMWTGAPLGANKFTRGMRRSGAVALGAAGIAQSTASHSAKLGGRVGRGGMQFVRAGQNGDVGAALGEAGKRLGGRVARKAGRQTAKGSMRAAQLAMRAAQWVAAKVMAGMAMLLSSVGGFGLGIGLVLAIGFIVIASIVPSWFANHIFDSDSAAEPTTAIVAPMGDDYPWKSSALASFNQVNSETRYYFGNCTDFVFWRVNRDMGGGPGHWVYTHDDLTPKGGNGRQWGKPGNLPGWETVTDPRRGVQGDIVSFETGTFGHNNPAGHVAYFYSVNAAGDVVTENYGSGRYYVETIPHEELAKEMASGRIVIKHNPKLGAKRAGSSGVNPKASQIVSYAMGQQGVPYGRGRGKGSVDCCWLVHNAYASQGIQTPMNVPGNPWATSKCEYAAYALASSYGGHYVDLAQAQPGDIVFMQDKSIPKSKDNLTHLAIYVGDGKIVDAIPKGGVGVRELSYYSRTETIEPKVVRVNG